MSTYHYHLISHGFNYHYILLDMHIAEHVFTKTTEWAPSTGELLMKHRSYINNQMEICLSLFPVTITEAYYQTDQILSLDL